MGLSRQAYYQRNRSADQCSEQDSLIAQVVREVRMRQPRLGARKLHFLLQDQTKTPFHVGRDRQFRGLAEHRLLVKPKRAYHKATHSFHRFYRHPNLLKPGQQQVLPIGGGHYLSAEPDRSAVPEPGHRCLFAQDRQPSRPRQPA